MSFIFSLHLLHLKKTRLKTTNDLNMNRVKHRRAPCICIEVPMMCISIHGNKPAIGDCKGYRVVLIESQHYRYTHVVLLPYNYYFFLLLIIYYSRFLFFFASPIITIDRMYRGVVTCISRNFVHTTATAV